MYRISLIRGYSYMQIRRPTRLSHYSAVSAPYAHHWVPGFTLERISKQQGSQPIVAEVNILG